MRVRTFPERYLAYVEGAIERALREIETGAAPEFCFDERLTGTAMVMTGATDIELESPPCAHFHPATARRKAARSTR